jgi:hypothetical protein
LTESVNFVRRFAVGRDVFGKDPANLARRQKALPSHVARGARRASLDVSVCRHRDIL